METHVRRRADVAGLVIAVVLLALAGVIWWDMTEPRSSPRSMASARRPCRSSSRSGLRILAIGNGIMALRGDLPARESARLASRSS